MIILEVHSMQESQCSGTSEKGPSEKGPSDNVPSENVPSENAQEK